MKKSTFFFLVLVLAAAVVTGSTLGVISNIDLIKNAVQNQNQSAMQDANVSNPETTGTDNESQDQPQDKSVQTASAGSTSTQVMVVSPEENVEITSMLVKLGMTNENDSGKFIKQYQTNHGIKPTGNIDSITLNTIINDVKLQRATEMTQQ